MPTKHKGASSSGIIRRTTNTNVGGHMLLTGALGVLDGIPVCMDIACEQVIGLGRSSHFVWVLYALR